LIEKLKSIFIITRPVNIVITIISVIVAAFISVQNYTLSFEILLAGIAASLTAASGYIINDIFDIEIDKVNRPDRPLPIGKISTKQAYIISFLFGSISLIISYLVSIPALIIVIVSHFILIIYSKYLKRIPLIGNITVAFLTGLVFIYGGVVAGNPSAAVIPAVFAFLVNLIREIVKDIQDIEGDSSAGLTTFPIKFGFQKSKALILVLTISLILYTIYPFITQIYKIEYFIIVVIVVNPVLVYSLKVLYYQHSETSLKKTSNLLKLSMVFGLIAILLG